MADLEGRLKIELQRCDSGVAATVRSSRPCSASRVFVGKGIAETAAGLPALFSICATAQACACASACEAALGLTPSPALARLRRLLVDAETIREHLWRMLLDWPRFLDEPPRAQAMQSVVRACAGLRAALTAGADPLQPGAGAPTADVSAVLSALDALARLSAEHIFGTSSAGWLGAMQTAENLLAWAGETDTAAARLLREARNRSWLSAGGNGVTALPRLSIADLEPLLSRPDADRFVSEPFWMGEPRESSPFTRQLDQVLVNELTKELGNGLLARLVAQLVELASLQQTLRTELDRLDQAYEAFAAAAGPGAGIALVPAARGLLVHRVVVDQERIRDYRILAPTEWNFHPRGVVAQGLSALPPSDAATLERLASLFITAVDPCVEYHVSVA